MFETAIGLLGALGPAALAGGPLGVAIAWLGSMAANKTVKLVAIGAGLLLVVGVSVGLTVHIQRLKQDRADLKILRASVGSLQTRYHCDGRPVHERDLATCLTARERDVAEIQAAEIRRQRSDAAAEQARSDREAAALLQEQAAADREIEAAAPGDDGPVPRVLLKAWARERAARGVK